MSRLLWRVGTSMVALLVVLGVTPGVAAAATATPPAPAFGVQFHGMWSSYDDASRALFLDQIAASGTTWVRVDLSWAMLQPTSRDSYDLAWGVPFADHVLKMVTARGLRPLVTLWLTPPWANGGQDERTLPIDAADYARAAQWAAARWADTVPAWEIWNEPNDNDFLRGADPVAYTRLLRAAYPAIKAGSPAARVVFGGPASNDTAWIEKTYAAGAGGFFDTMATHPYQAIADEAPEVPDDGTRYHFTHLTAVHALMAAHGDGDKEIWATEFGWSSHANSGTEANWERGVTRAQQADFLVRALRLTAATMPYVTHLFWYTDRDFTDQNAQNSNYGIFDAALRPKPVYDALRNALTGGLTAAVTTPAATPSTPTADTGSATEPTVTAPTVTAPTVTAPTATTQTVTAPIVTVAPGWRWGRSRVGVSTGASANVRQRLLRR
ncbi:MAG: polysaccharide biosynthesis protein PslG [Actinomycetota bacterium]|nr:polysaccharide biosynthesis protein PslG [Actinomycetota bacterium]